MTAPRPTPNPTPAPNTAASAASVVSPLHTVTLVLLVGAVIALSFETRQARRSAALAQRNAARGDSIAAALDTTRAEDGRALAAARTLYGDSIDAVERRVQQLAPSTDALDKALARVSTTAATLEGAVRALHATATAPVVTGPVNAPGDTTKAVDVRSATFHVRETPYTADARVTLPASGSGTLGLDVTLDTARVAVRLQCGQPVGGFAPATALIVPPAWLAVRIDSVRQSPDVCNPPAPRRWYDGRFSIGPAASLVVDPSGVPRVGLGVSAQLAVWRWP